MCFFKTGAPEDPTESGSGEAGDRTCNPWFTRHSTYPLHQGGFYLKISSHSWDKFKKHHQSANVWWDFKG